jgi:uncharacterized protein
MIRLSELKLPLSSLPSQAPRASDAPSETEADRAPKPHPHLHLTKLVAQTLGILPAAISRLEVFKRSFDARKADILAVYIVDVSLSDPSQEAALLQQFQGHAHITATPHMAWHPPAHMPAEFGQAHGERPVVVGFGPCGMLAALALAQMGLKPIVLERGKSVRERTQDTWGLWRKNVLQPESNVQFGEGGAGTFSDGKLWSQIRDPRHLGRKVMQEFVTAGAPAEILYEAHPHIGTFKLVRVVEGIRQRIEALGGEVRFGQRVVDVLLQDKSDSLQNTEQPIKSIQGLKVFSTITGATELLPARQVVLALGHSARDTFAMLFDRGVAMQAKAFSVGFRIEHPQGVIDRARWGRHAGHPLLGAADYKLVHHASNGRSVYSFCMCPGGTVVAATSEIGRVVTNGMSQYSRNERNANAGIVVGIDAGDFPGGAAQEASDWLAAFGAQDGPRYQAQAAALAQTPAHPLSGIVLQRQLESRAFVLGGSNYQAPGQRVGDFLAGHASTTLGSVQPSYKPGVMLGDLASTLPGYAIEAIREALPAFGKKIKGFDMFDAMLTGVETRTSSPLRMPRGENLQSTNIVGLYPAGEGAGYAGGILSAGVDGIRVAEALATAALKDCKLRTER